MLNLDRITIEPNTIDLALIAAYNAMHHSSENIYEESVRIMLDTLEGDNCQVKGVIRIACKCILDNIRGTPNQCLNKWLDCESSKADGIFLELHGMSTPQLGEWLLGITLYLSGDDDFKQSDIRVNAMLSEFDYEAMIITIEDEGAIQ